LNDLQSTLHEQLTASKQEHLISFWNELSEIEKINLSNQIESIDFDLFAVLQSRQADELNKHIEPCEILALDDTFKSQGIASIERGEIGILTVAGGQGTRLDWNGPKGTFPATPITGKSLFQLIAEQILWAIDRYKTNIPWYIMTSIENDSATRSFLLDNNCFGLKRTDIFIFTQGEVPAVDSEGNMILESKSKIAMNPDGHGGVISALQQSGGLDEMSTRGIKYLTYVQIDNPLARAIDPNFIGLHLSEKSSCEASSKCVLKTNPDERVGVFCKVNGNLEIVEYSDLPTDKANELDSDEKLVYAGGSIAMHIFTVSFLQRVVGDLPWHRANKKVRCIDLQTGECCENEAPNAFKFEKFVFDVLPFASSSIVAKTKREEEFAPIKNATGLDSPKTSHQMQQVRAISWLRSRGVEVSDTAMVEVSPLSGSCAEDIDISKLPKSIGPDETVVI
jgi:UDP-N-acetylglucosamine/UDP-N-acetylgalactosamine diphosphorylase